MKIERSAIMGELFTREELCILLRGCDTDEKTAEFDDRTPYLRVRSDLVKAVRKQRQQPEV